MALTRNKPRVYSTVTRRNSLALATATAVFEGSAIGINASTGLGRPVVAGDLFAGFAAGAATSARDVTGAAPTAVQLVSDGEVLLVVSGVTATSIGASVFATDDDTFALTGTTLVGEVLRVPAAGQAVVAFVGGRNRLSSVQVAAGQALVSGGGIGPSSTFASLPAAADNAGNSYRVTDVGPVGCGSIWISDGTRWRPLGGRQLHCAASGTLAAPLVTLSGAAGKFTLPAGDRVTAGSILLPVGLPQIGQGVEVSAKVLHRGTAGTWNFVGRLGSLDTSSDPSFMQVTGAATNDQSCWLHQDLEVVSATSFVASTFAVPNQAGTGAVVLRNSNFNNAAQLYLSFYSSTFTSGDFIDLISYRVYLIG